MKIHKANFLSLSTALTILFYLIGYYKCNGYKILELNDTNFEEYRQNHQYVLIYFHANYSEESKFLQLHFKRLPGIVPDKIDIVYAIISQKSYLTNHKYDVQFPYPRIYLINKDIHYIYNGEINTNQIADWIHRKINKQLWMLKSVDELIERLEQFQRIVCVTGDSRIIDQFEYNSKIIENFPDIHFFGISNNTIISNLKLDKEDKNLNPKILILKNYDDMLNVYRGDLSNSTNVHKFIRTYTYPIVNYFSSTNYLYVVNNKYSFSVLLLPKVIEESESEKIYDQYYDSAKFLRGTLFFMYGNFSDQQQTTLAVDFETEQKDLPALFIQEYIGVDDSENKIIRRYKLSNIKLNNLEMISEFFNKYKKGVLNKFLRSERLPNKENLFVNNVYSLVKKNFNKIIIGSNENKYSLVYFVRRNCGPCNEHKKIFMEIADLYKNNKATINFGIIDGIMNEFDEFEILGYPSVLLFKAG